MLKEDISTSSDSFERYRERITNFSNEFEPALFLAMAGKSILWAILFFTVSLTTAFLYLRYTPKVYESSTILQINNSNNANKVLDAKNIYEGDAEDKQLAGDIELLRSRVFLKRALSTLPLSVSYFEEGTFKTNEHYKESPYTVESKLKTGDIRGIRIYITRKSPVSGEITYTIPGKSPITRTFKSGEWITDLPQAELNITLIDKSWKGNTGNKKKQFYFVINDLESLAASYNPRLSVTMLSDAAKTVKILFRDNNALKTSDVVNAVSSEFISYDVERRGESAKSVLEFIDNQLESVFNRLKNSEATLGSFKREYKLSENKELTITNMARLNSLEDESARMEMEKSILDEIETKVKSDSKQDVSKLIAMLTGSNNLAALNSQIETLYKMVIEREQALFQNREENQSVKWYDYQIDLQRKMLIESIAAIRTKLQTQSEQLDKLTKRYEIKYTDPSAEVEFGRLQHLYEINEKFYTLLLEKKTEYQISKAGFISHHLILETPITPNVPVFPNPNISFTLAIFSASILSLLLVLIRYLIHDKISSLNEITRHTSASISILGIVPKYKKDIPISQLLVDKNPKSLIAEAFRSVRSNMHFIADENGPKVMTVTSTISGEGKTFVALNLAGIIAYSGKRVIILDLDMRKPKIHLGLEVSNLKGMSTILIGRDQVDECINHSQLENMDFITSGPIPPNPSELMLSSKMYQVIDYLKTKYDMIIIDNPPVGLVTDGIDLMRKADYPIYIFRAEYSKKSFIQNVDRLQNESGIKKLSVILNGVDIEKRGYGYNYGYGHGYGYGYGSNYGYYDESKPGKKSTKKG
jgi:tyrosine-protein kinase Etk/Wzc